MNELIKEARTKIKPVLMSEEERDLYVDGLESSKKTDLINIEGRAHLILDAENITLEILRKI